ncbi:Aflatoxin B1 aldehyde reductase member 3 [Cytospora mali]|uniref:Aflatoxin B1 aldehyde reductase member 3 n=1 Tax=Cytospora mali TaxID=578113 RepID=A0A194UNW8_CYTMA|nr:Aflatoxin B1 aldehyde reductase member 3 [Valsa mali var. pyri (nom. inval.)]
MTGAKVVFGAGAFTSGNGFDSEKVKDILEVIEELGIKTIDTSACYDESEEFLGENCASTRFTIDTKLPGLQGPDPSTKEVVITTGNESLEKLKTKQVDVYYIHVPDSRVPFEETLEGIHSLYQAGAFQRFGLSNFSPDQTKEVIRICQERNYVLPTVYQGNYNAVARRAETDLFPILRDNNISFYAYSPIAGGFLAKTPEGLRKGGKGRWDPESFVGKIYRSLYADKPATMAALGKWHEVADAEGISALEMAYRWVVHNSILDESKGDAVVIGPRSPAQLRGAMEAIRKGPLSAECQGKIDAIWKIVENGSFLDNLSGSVLAQGEGVPEG